MELLDFPRFQFLAEFRKVIRLCLECKVYNCRQARGEEFTIS